MDRANHRGRIGIRPGRLRKGVRLLRIFPEQMLDGTRNLPQLPRHGKQVHLVILVADLVGHAARPCLDLVELELLLVVSGLADIDGLALGEPSWPTFGVSGDEHDEATVVNFLDAVVTILARLDDLVLKEVLLKPMDRLLGAVVPAGIHPLVANTILPGPINLGNNRFPWVVGVGNMDPVTYTMLAKLC